MTDDVSLFRLYLMRAMYLAMALFLGFGMGPALIRHAPVGNLMHGVARCLLAGIAVLAVLALRYPVRMLPLLLLELVWKALWLLAIGLPLWRARQLDPASAETARACLIGIPLLLLVIPWPHVLQHYVKRPADRWR